MTTFEGHSVLLVAGIALAAVTILTAGLRLMRIRKARKHEAALAKERADLIFDAEIRRVLLRVRGNQSV